MLSRLFAAWALLSACVIIHALGVTSALPWIRRRESTSRELWPATWLLVRLAGWIVLLHVIQIAVWAVFYVWVRALPELRSALYFSAVTYTTTGYGDVVLPTEWQLVGAVEALTGILMCGLSTGFFFAVLSRLLKAKPAPRDPDGEA